MFGRYIINKVNFKGKNRIKKRKKWERLELEIFFEILEKINVNVTEILGKRRIQGKLTSVWFVSGQE